MIVLGEGAGGVLMYGEVAPVQLARYVCLRVRWHDWASAVMLRGGVQAVGDCAIGVHGGGRRRKGQPQKGAEIWNRPGG